MKNMISIFMLLAALLSTQAHACDENMAYEKAVDFLKYSYSDFNEDGETVKIYVSWATRHYEKPTDASSPVRYYTVRYFIDQTNFNEIGELRFASMREICMGPTITSQSTGPVFTKTGK